MPTPPEPSQVFAALQRALTSLGARWYVFGAQAVHEDDGVRAVDTAQAFLARLREPVLQGELPLTVRLAVTSGPVVAGPIGSPQQPEFMVTGEPLQVAQHLAAATPQGAAPATTPITPPVEAPKPPAQKPPA